jgi:hypothetical protein
MANGCANCKHHKVFWDDMDGEQLFDGCICAIDKNEHDDCCLFGSYDGFPLRDITKDCPYIDKI